MKKQLKTEITSKSTADGIHSAIKETAAMHGLRGGTWSQAKIKEGWLVCVIFAIPGGHDHWNYHPARRELQKTHTTMGVINVSDALDESMEALRRLYPQETQENEA